MKFREFVAKRFGKWPETGDLSPEGYKDWNHALWEAMADWSDEGVSTPEWMDMRP